MDEHARHRSRGVRTIGRLASVPAEDLLLAQWPLPADPAYQRQDVAVASGWASRHSAGQAGRHLMDSDPIWLCDQFHHHQQQVLDRLLEAIDLELAGGDRVALVFETPPTLQDDLLAIVQASARNGDLPAAVAEQLSQRVVVAGESVARLWALIELYRCDLIAADELRTKRDTIEREFRSLPVIDS